VDSHAYDSWEFKSNGGLFAPHCVKGTRGWLRVHQDAPEKQRFVPMTSKDSVVLVGEKGREDGVCALTAKDLAVEAVERKVGLYFEKEVYSMFSNPMAELVLQEIGCVLGVDWSQIQIDVIGYCTGGYCVDAAVERLCNMDSVFESKIRVLSYATAAIGGLEGMNLSKNRLTSYGAEWVEI
jgi:nicotinamidase/pyrazinamidase